MKQTLFILLTILIFSCKKKEEEEPTYFRSKFYPVQKGQYVWNNTAFFKNVPISFKLESRLGYKDSEGKFEDLIYSTLSFSTDRDLFINNTKIPAKTNLFDNGIMNIAEIETIQRSTNNEKFDDFYILWINKNNTNSINSKGYFTFYFKSTTKNNYTINDSTLINIE